MIKAVQSQASMLAKQVSPKGDDIKPDKTEQTKDLDRVANIKEQIANGSYALKMDKTAEAIAQELLG